MPRVLTSLALVCVLVRACTAVRVVATASGLSAPSNSAAVTARSERQLQSGPPPLALPLAQPLPLPPAPRHRGGAFPCPATDLAVDTLVYGGTAGGVVAAVAAGRMLRAPSRPASSLWTGAAAPVPSDSRPRVLLLNPSSNHLGGMVSSGLGMTDGKDSGGIAREFFEAAGGYRFAPSKAERAFVGLATNASVRWAGECRLVSVDKAATGELKTVTTSAGGTITARVSILGGGLASVLLWTPPAYQIVHGNFS